MKKILILPCKCWREEGGKVKSIGVLNHFIARILSKKKDCSCNQSGLACGIYLNVRLLFFTVGFVIRV
jgi:hypothetical protein